MFGPQQSWKEEKRTDIYYPHSPAVGIKERGVTYSEVDRASVNGIEVKFRKEVDETGFEKWKKKKVRGEEELNRELHENGHVGLPAVSSMSRCSTVVKLEKLRRKGSNGAADMEETQLIVTPATRPNPKYSSSTSSHLSANTIDLPDYDQGEPETWRTVSLEGKRKAFGYSAASLSSACKALAIGGEIMICAYPEFICTVAAEYESSRPQLRQERNRVPVLSPPPQPSQSPLDGTQQQSTDKCHPCGDSTGSECNIQ